MNLRLPRHEVIFELFVWVISIGASMTLLRDLLYTGFATLPHDNLFWNLPIFSFYAERILNGGLPLWNPFTHGGEPFSPLLLQLRLLDPIPLLTVVIGHFFSRDTVILFNWNRILQNYTMAFGTYLCLRPFFRRTFTRCLITPLLLFSSFFFCSFRQDGISSMYLWIPFVLLFLFRIFLWKKKSIREWIALGLFIGLSSQSYYFVGPWTLLLLFFSGLYLFHRPSFISALSGVRIYRWGIALTLGIIILMFLPNLAVWQQSRQMIFPLRMVPDNFKETLLHVHGLLPSEADPSFYSPDLKMDYSFVMHTGSFLKIWEWIQLLAPEANGNISGIGRRIGWGDPSESYLFFGLLGWGFAIFGILFGKGENKRLWLWLTAGFFLLALGPAGLLHPVLFPVFPPLWFLRHTHQFTLFFVIGLLYFLGTGIDRFLDPELFSTLCRKMARGRVKSAAVGLAYAAIVAALFWWSSQLEYPVFKFSTTNFLFVALFIIVFLGYLIHRPLGKGVTLFALLSGQIATVLILSPHRESELLYLILLLALPLALCLFFARRFKNHPSLMALVIALFLLADLGRGVRFAAPLYAGTPTLSYLLGVDLRVQPETFEFSREVFPLYSKFFYGTQTPRYLETLYRRRYAFSAPLIFNTQTGQDHPVTVEHALNNPRWNSISLLKNYFNLVNDHLPNDTLENFFAIGRNVFELRAAAIRVPIQGFNDQLTFLRDLAPNLRTQLQNRVVFIHDNPKNLPGLVLTPEKTFPLLKHLRGSIPFQYRLLKYHPEMMELELGSSAAAYLYWSDGYDPAWRARLDGNDIPLFRANINFKALSLPPGIHHLTLTYEPTGFLWSAGIFYFVLLSGLLLIGLNQISWRMFRFRERFFWRKIVWEPSFAS